MPRNASSKSILVFDSGPGPLRLLWQWRWSDANRAVAAGEAEWGRLGKTLHEFSPISESEATPDASNPLAIRLLGKEPTPTWIIQSRGMRERGVDRGNGMNLKGALAVIREAQREMMPGATSWHGSSEHTPAPAH